MNFPRNKRNFVIVFSVALFIIILVKLKGSDSPDFEVNRHKEPVPNIIHFVHFVNRDDGKHHSLLEQLESHMSCLNK